MALPRGSGRTAAARILAAVAAIVVLVHAVLQATGSLEFWAPCFAFGHTSGACSYLQYEAPGPWWLGLMAWWPVEVIATAVVCALSFGARTRTTLAFVAFGCVLLSNMVTDYVLTPLFNGGFTSADNPPGFGMFGAVLLGASGVLLVLVAVLPARRADRVPATDALSATAA
jgi:hypothetical protein